MIKNIAYSLILGKPVVMYFGLITIILLLTTATIGYLAYRGKVNFSWHKAMAATTITVAVIHAVLALSLYLNY